MPQARKLVQVCSQVPYNQYHDCYCWCWHSCSRRAAEALVALASPRRSARWCDPRRPKFSRRRPPARPPWGRSSAGRPQAGACDIGDRLPQKRRNSHIDETLTVYAEHGAMGLHRERRRHARRPNRPRSRRCKSCSPARSSPRSSSPRRHRARPVRAAERTRPQHQSSPRNTLAENPPVLDQVIDLLEKLKVGGTLTYDPPTTSSSRARS